MAHQAADTTKFVVGLGNPGTRYARTRHNVGFRVLDVLRELWRMGEPRAAFEGLLIDGRVSRPGAEAQRVMLLAPQTYMNCSGRSVRAMLDFYKGAPDELLVVLDDLALPPGRLRLRAEGSAGGHNGLDDVLRVVGTTRVARLRIGIGAAPAQMDPADYVLGRFGPDEQDAIDVAIRVAADAVEDWLFGGIDSAMAKYNRKTDE
ncbi:MAG TPA: aminoacyl-tRNA hydrolase [Phycisphaerales bacterium]|nr:aminoacyl-tRNA hydrolase [Phycisphaerales bacterium]